DAGRVVLLARGEARAHGRHAHGTLTELRRGHGEEERAVDAPRVADEHGAHLAEEGAQALELGFGLDHAARHNTPRTRLWIAARSERSQDIDCPRSARKGVAGASVAASLFSIPWQHPRASSIGFLRRSFGP